MPLRPPQPIIPADQLGAVHFIAIGGSGMSGIAELYARAGHRVTGSDMIDSDIIEALRTSGVTCYIGHDAAQLGDADTVVVSSAIRDTNPELAEARRRGLRILHRSEALASLMVGCTAVSVAGTHGKTTTTAMIAHLLASVGADPSYVTGSYLATTAKRCDLGSGDVFVVEADESDGSFLQYPTEIAVITSVDADHLDNWGTSEAYANGFYRFATQPTVRTVVIDIDNAGSRALYDRLTSPDEKTPHRLEVISYGQSDSADVQIRDISLSGMNATATLRLNRSLVTPFATIAPTSVTVTLQVPGVHNLADTTAAIIVGLLTTADPDLAALAAGAGQFRGTMRRFELVGKHCGITVIDDHAHHPAEMNAAVTTARHVAGTGRVIACFQPQLYTRTRDFADDFGAVLAHADIAVVTDVWGSREDPIEGVTGELVCDAVTRHGGTPCYIADKDDVPVALLDIVRPGDLVMTLGTGDEIGVVAHRYAELLAANERHKGV